jgi:hypothetical protein
MGNDGSRSMMTASDQEAGRQVVSADPRQSPSIVGSYSAAVLLVGP